jgi:hypothetical protein
MEECAISEVNWHVASEPWAAWPDLSGLRAAVSRHADARTRRRGACSAPDGEHPLPNLDAHLLDQLSLELPRSQIVSRSRGEQ